jgi:hypothetical protein
MTFWISIFCPTPAVETGFAHFELGERDQPNFARAARADKADNRSIANRDCDCFTRLPNAVKGRFRPLRMRSGGNPRA